MLYTYYITSVWFYHEHELVIADLNIFLRNKDTYEK